MIARQLSLFSRKDTDVSIQPDTPMMLNVSGGKDSLAMMLYSLATYPENPKTVVYNDTGFEHPGLWDYLKAIVDGVGLPIVKLNSPGLFPIIRKRGNVPSQLCRFCTSSLKREPSAKWLRAHYKTGNVVNCFGLRAEESRTRATLDPVAIDKALTTKKRTVYRFNPVLHWSVDDVLSYLDGEGVTLFHTYEYLSRLSCRFCFLAGKRDQEAVKLNDPEGYEQIQALRDEIRGITG